MKSKKDISSGITTTGDIDIMEILYAPLKPEEKRKLQLEEFKAEGIEEDLKDPVKKYKQIVDDLRYLGNSGFADFGKEGAWKAWSKEDILKYFAACVEALRSVYIPLISPTDEKLYKIAYPGKNLEKAKKTSYWKCYDESKRYINSNAPENEEELKEWINKRTELLEDLKKQEKKDLEEKEEVDFLNIKADNLQEMTDKQIRNLHQEGHYYWQLYEAGKLKDVEILVNNHVLIVQELTRRNLKHFDANGLDSLSGKFFPGYDKKGFSLLFEHEQIHQEYHDEPCELLFLQHMDSEKALMKNGYHHTNHGDDLDKYYIWHNEHELARVNSSGEVNGRRILLEEVLGYLKKGFRLRSPYVYLSGGLVNNSSTLNDIEIIIQCTQSELDSRQGHLLKWRIMRMFPPDLARRLHFLPTTHIGPVTNNIPLYALSCEKINENDDIFEMSIDKVLNKTKALMAKKQMQDNGTRSKTLTYSGIPYVLSDRAVTKAWVPPVKFSALHNNFRKKVPAKFQYWTKSSKEERVKIRDAYVSYLKKTDKYDEFKKSFDLPEREAADFNHWLVSDFLDCKIKDVFANSIFIPQPKTGNFLKAFQEIMKDFQILDIRSFDKKGYEAPPVSQVIKLNSTTEEDFLIDGMQFMENNLGQQYVAKFTPDFGGLDFTLISRTIFKELNKKLISAMFDWIKENNFLKNEKFTLSGDFLKAPDIEWEDLKLEKSLKDNILRINKSIIEEGKNFSRGLLMLGPPGVGKTLSCKLLMKNANSTFIWVTAKEFSSSALSMAFSLARELAPTILCFEDIDTYIDGHCVDLFKTELDGLIANEGLCVILTTNHPERLPLALLDRPGRFHDICNFEVPNLKVRQEMISHFAKEEIGSEAMRQLIKETEGFSGAHLRELVTFAKRIQIERKCGLDEAFIASLEKLKKQKNLVAEILENKERVNQPFQLGFLKDIEKSLKSGVPEPVWKSEV